MTFRENLGLYLHIPFCASRCNYCHFNTYAGLEGLIPQYVDALEEEIGLWGQALKGRADVRTIFFGGGTPSLLSLGDVGRVLGQCRRFMNVSPDAEITIESNPGDLSFGFLRGLLSLGVNRLSIGVQIFNDGHLKALGRRHTSQEAIDACRLARRAGFINTNLDLIYGLPGQTLGEWEATLKQSLVLETEHLSLYALQIEEDTPMWKEVRSGSVAEPDQDLAADMYVMAEEMLGKAGYTHYEISNWAKPQKECLHNMTYWLNRPYLGLGAGAHSFLGRFRFSNVLRPRTYIEKTGDLAREATQGIQGALSAETIRKLGPVRDSENIDESLEMAETMILGLRLVRGVELAAFAQRFGKEVTSIYETQIGEFKVLGLLAQANGYLYLTQRGRLLGNEVFVRFLPPCTKSHSERSEESS
ncbi:MAG: radical SAM family heme chaperone HemW [Chloroflexi bacterium]|nr:radical SAM family heme chaperone HemW [Chloroflexota bacterium]